MPTKATETRDVYSEIGELRGLWTRGTEPKELVLSDGSRLALRPAEEGRARWERRGRGDDADSVSVDEAVRMAGHDFAGYVAVRTRSEAEWLRSISDWCRGEAERLDRELAAAG